MNIARCVDPERTCIRILRRSRLDCRRPIGFSRHSAKAVLDTPTFRQAPFRLQTAVIREVCGIEVFLVREENGISAHGDDLLNAASGQRQTGDGISVVVDRPVVHIEQGVFRNEALRIRSGGIGAAFCPRSQNRIVVRGQILHVVEFSVPDAEVVVVAPEDVGHLPGGVQLLQIGKPHLFFSFQNRNRLPLQTGMCCWL